jgi:uncharacterized protein YbaA (DUF1428 family)
MKYVDGFVLPVQKKNLGAYKKMARIASRVWKEHGALEYKECIGEDLDVKMGLTFPKAIKRKANETVFFSWIVFKSRAHRDKVNAAVMNDPRISGMDSSSMPFDTKRMVYGGFSVLVES